MGENQSKREEDHKPLYLLLYVCLQLQILGIWGLNMVSKLSDGICLLSITCCNLLSCSFLCISSEWFVFLICSFLPHKIQQLTHSSPHLHTLPVWRVIQTYDNPDVFHYSVIVKIVKVSAIFFSDWHDLIFVTEDTLYSFWLMLPRLGIAKDFLWLYFSLICEETVLKHKGNWWLWRWNWRDWKEDWFLGRNLGSCLWKNSSLSTSAACFARICTHQ